MTAEIDPALLSPDDPGDETTRCRDLVVLCFRAVLRRVPDENDAAAFTNALLSGMPLYDFISELMSTPEFRATSPSIPDPPCAPAPPPADATLPQLMVLSLGLMQSRLTDKGCMFQLGPTPDPYAAQGVDATRMERVTRTLAVLDLL